MISASSIDFLLNPVMGGLFSPLVQIGLFVFLVSTFLGFEVITKVPQMLHTPLMSGANAISGITIMAALTCAVSNDFNMTNLVAFFAITFAMINVVGGFLVTDRMLEMFKKKN